MIRLCLILVAVLGFGPPAPGQNEHIFVFVDGSAPGPGIGTEADPFTTITDAINYAFPHDFLFVKPGVYQEALQIPFFVFITAIEGPERTVINATGLAGDYAVTMDVLAQLNGFTVTKADGGGIYAEVQSGGPEFGRIIRGNWIRNCAGHGIHLVGPCHPSVVENLVFDNAGTGVVLEDGASPYFVGNTVTRNAVGFERFGLLPDAAAKFGNSIVFGNTVELSGVSPGFFQTSILGDASLSGVAGCLYASPAFVDQNAADFRLQDTSPGIDAGDPLIVPYSSLFDAQGYGHLRVVDGDHDGIARVDMGGLERGGLAFRQTGVGVGSTVELEIDAAPGALFHLALGIPNTNPEILGPTVAGYLMLEPASLVSVLVTNVGSNGRWNLLLPIADPALVGLELPLQALVADLQPTVPRIGFTNVERLKIR